MAERRHRLLWDRERRAARRHWWHHPWVMPVVALVCILLSLVVWNQPLPSITVPRGSVRAELPWVEGLLILWIVWLIAVTLTRERGERTTATLGVTLISPREVALTKTFAPIYPALIAWVGLIVTRFMVVIAVSVGRLARETVVLWTLDLEFWALHVWGDYRWWGLRRETLLGLFSPWAEMIARATLYPLCLVTVTAWVSARMRSAARATAAALGICAAAVALFHLPAFALSWLAHADPPTRTQWRSDDFQPLSQALVALEIVWFAAIHLLIPAAWLLWWWRWTANGFQHDFFNEE